MAVLFLSHSSKDDALASSIEAWLHQNGFTDTFVDHASLAGGSKWRVELRASAGACRVIICLVTENWLASSECFDEFRAAWYMGKRIVPLFLLVSRDDLGNESKNHLGEISAEDQGIDLTICRKPDGTLDLDADASVATRLNRGLRAAGALAAVGLDPEAFAIDRKSRPTPFPGLAPFGDDDADAAIFYGRSREIAEVLETLRQMRAAAERRPLIILGASGSGKSSLLKAGIIPRLRREARTWLPLRAFRPGTDPLLHFAEALASTMADFGRSEAQGDIRDRLFSAWSSAQSATGGDAAARDRALGEALEAEAHRLRAGGGRLEATILVSLDQAEELTHLEGESCEALADYLRVALTSARSWQLAVTIRTDNFPDLQHSRHFRHLEARGYDLRAIPAFRFESVVQEPARRYGVDVDSALIDTLIKDAPGDDALPLLAFALQRLWSQYEAAGTLNLDQYTKMGGLDGLIEDAAERALRGLSPQQDVPLPVAPPAKRLEDLGASTFVPALARINEKGIITRRIAAWDMFNDEQRELLDRFTDWYLVVRKTEPDGVTVEVTAEALFRKWRRMDRWLEPERKHLEAMRLLQLDASTWDHSARRAAFLNHRGRRLAEAEKLVRIERYRTRLAKTDTDYLNACRVRQRNVRVGLLGSIGVVALAAWWFQPWLHDEWKWLQAMKPYMRANVLPAPLMADVERQLAPKGAFTECSAYCPEMIVIPAGSFLMGSPDDEVGRYPREGPRHKVTIAKPFAVSKFDVTFDEYYLCVWMRGCRMVGDGNMGTGTKPVVNVTWDDARHFVVWLSKFTGRQYRLLSEAEWEYAARAGTVTPYYWGRDFVNRQANCNDCGTEWDGKLTSPVGSFPPNPFGLYDMVGNVYQWLEDCWHDSYSGAPDDGSARTDDNCSVHVGRGSDWADPSPQLRSAWRGYGPVDVSDVYTGFRVARTLAPTKPDAAPAPEASQSPATWAVIRKQVNLRDQRVQR